ncbi:hypothetical protein KVT40_000678 [Elsinoe batatas]|uniref:Uncharacterized protein n=1 Tax=Elsinoe batatas TaxID=2601811 RepID=A0A8K0LG44_9PEZI|nr:hypothetical protein KVT40_000678 [Elsinoe batatas]
MNMYVYGDLICKTCLDKIFAIDPAWLEDTVNNVHLPALAELISGPELYQCFCGYCTFRLEYYREHLHDNPYDSEAVNKATTRLGKCDIHEQCRKKAGVALHPQPEGGKASL